MVEGLTGLAENIDAGGGQIVQSMDPVIGYMGNSVCCAFHPNPGGLGLGLKRQQPRSYPDVVLLAKGGGSVNLLWAKQAGYPFVHTSFVTRLKFRQCNST